MRDCAQQCKNTNKACRMKECRLWLEHDEDLNCTLLSIEKNGPMSLKEVGVRLKLSDVRIKQIQDKLLKKMRVNYFATNENF